MELKHRLRRAFRALGYDVVPFRPSSHPVARRRQLLKEYRIDTVLDVGANVGQTGLQLRGELNFRGRIVSFEPVTSAFTELKRRAAQDGNWDVFNVALGSRNSTANINVAGNTESSSLLPMLPSHERAAPTSRYVGREKISVRTLDSMWNEVRGDGGSVYLKIDTQGFEGRVIEGAEDSLAHIEAIQVEMSLAPLYHGEPGFVQLHSLLQRHCYALVALEPGFSNRKTGELLQVDGIYRRCR